MKLTQEFAARAGYRGDSPAMLRAIEAIRQQGIREARQMHMARLKKCRALHNPSMFSAAIHPADSVEEALADARHVISAYGRMSTWMKDRRRRQFVEANEMVCVCRYFRRYGKAIWARRAA